MNAAQTSVEGMSEYDYEVVLLHFFEQRPILLSSGDRFRPRDDFGPEKLTKLHAKNLIESQLTNRHLIVLGLNLSRRETPIVSTIATALCRQATFFTCLTTSAWFRILSVWPLIQKDIQANR